MTTTYATAPTWPAEPGPTSSVTARLDWYAATARWAPSKHNSQPWRFVVTDDALEVWADPSRSLVETDAHRRELVLSCGAAMHLAGVAARAHGVAPLIVLFPDGPGGCVARLVERGPWQVTPADRALLLAVPRRRTDRGPLDALGLAPALAFELQDVAEALGCELRLVASPWARATLAELVARADRLLVRARGPERELSAWLRAPGDLRGDGVPSDHTRGPAASYRAEYVQRDFSTRSSTPSQDRPGADRPLLAVLCTATDGTHDHARAGAALIAVLLHATVAGANASFLNQPVEHPEMRQVLREQLQLDGHPQLVLRLGAGGEVTPPPRRRQTDLVFRSGHGDVRPAAATADQQHRADPAHRGQEHA